MTLAPFAPLRDGPRDFSDIALFHCISREPTTTAYGYRRVATGATAAFARRHATRLACRLYHGRQPSHSLILAFLADKFSHISRFYYLTPHYLIIINTPSSPLISSEYRSILTTLSGLMGRFSATIFIA
jgi:hypothetical protein